MGNPSLKDLAGHAEDLGFHDLAEVFRDAFDPDIRNGYAHADYVICDDGARLPKRNGGTPKIIYWPEIHARFERGINFFHVLRGIVTDYISSYNPARQVRGQSGDTPECVWTIHADPEKHTFTISSGGQKERLNLKMRNAQSVSLFSFKGRINRLKYFLSVTSLTIICAIVMYGGISLYYGEIQRAIGEGRYNPSILLSSGVIVGILLVFGGFVFLIWASVALTVRRLHDINLSGHHAWWIYTLMFLPTVASIKLTEAAMIPIGTLCWGLNIWLVISRGTNGDNRFGQSHVTASNRSSNTKTALVIAFCIGAAAQIFFLTVMRQVRAWGHNDSGITPNQTEHAKPVTSEEVIEQISGMSFALTQPGADESRIFDGVAKSIYEYLLTADAPQGFSAIEQVFSSAVKEHAKSLALDPNTKSRGEALLRRLLHFQQSITAYYGKKAAPVLNSHKLGLNDIPLLVERKGILDDSEDTRILLSALQENPTTK
jgi:uncharacterized membrane protein YhaH (DUF805 family)